MRWDEVSRIEAGHQPTPVVDIAFLVMHRGGPNDWILVDDMNRGFSDFLSVVLARWPQIRDDWNRLLTSSPDKDERIQLWKR
jgi:hypothetical protein